MDYDLDSLGWFQFERMCQSLLRSTHGAALETWGGNRDLGRDAYSSDRLRYPDPNQSREGPFVFQVKHITGANAAASKPGPALLSAVSREATRIGERIDDGTWIEPRVYSLLTNTTLTADLRASVSEILKQVLPECQVITTGGTEISAMLDDNASIRLSYPQILGIRDLEALITQAVNRHVRERSSFAIDEAKELARVFVATSMYEKTLRTLARHNFAVLTGPPEMGKTAIAQMVGLARFTDNWEIIECRGPDDFFSTHHRDSKQVFIADDAFGSTEYRPDLAYQWSSDLGKILSGMDRDHVLVWTSRPAPLREGLNRLEFKGKSREFPSPAQVEVNVAGLTLEEKAQMLYRHAKAAALSPDATKLVRAHAQKIVESDHFTPLRIERFISEQLPSILEEEPSNRRSAIEEAVADGLQRPTHSMSASFQALDEEHKAVLFALLETGSRATADVVISSAERYIGRPFRRDAEQIIKDIDSHFIRVRALRLAGMSV